MWSGNRFPGDDDGMPRSIWSGSISFGLVNVPIKLFTAVRKKDVHFNQLHEKDGAVCVTVSDEGIGIAPDALSRVFERYYRAEGMPDSSGMGIGLYIARSIAELHGGTLTVESELGEGATFTLTLPASRVEREPEGELS